MRRAEDDIALQSRQVADLMQEIDTLNDKLAQTDSRYRLLFNNMEGDKFDQANLHKMHVKLLSVRTLEESL